MNAIQRLREQLERAMVSARTIGDERQIGRAIVELQEAHDFREFAELHPSGSVRIPSDFSLPSPVMERNAVPLHRGERA